MHNYTIRPATPADIPALLELEQCIIEFERPLSPYLKEQDINYYDIPLLISDADSHMIVVESDSRIVGSGYAQIRQSKSCYEHEQHCYLGFIYLDPQFRGNSLGQEIMQTLQAWGVARGMKHFQLNVYSENEFAVRAYEKAGFKKVSVLMELVV